MFCSLKDKEQQMTGTAVTRSITLLYDYNYEEEYDPRSSLHPYEYYR